MNEVAVVAKMEVMLGPAVLSAPGQQHPLPPPKVYFFFPIHCQSSGEGKLWTGTRYIFVPITHIL